MFLRVIRMRIHDRHPGGNKAKHNHADGYQKNRNSDFHPVRKIAFTGRQVPVEGHQTDVEAIDDNTQYGPGSGPFDYFNVFFAHPDGIEKTGQRDETQDFE